MNDIFISYASEDRDWVVSLADVLRQQGWTVWWDRSIPFGKSFQEVIETALNEARCVIVVWSRHSVGSGWVSAEADEARNRGILVPVLIDDAAPPLVFRQLQTANLSDWNGDSTAPVFRKLTADIAALLGEPVSQSRFSPPTTPEPAKKNRHHWPWYAGLAGLFVVAGLWFSNLQEHEPLPDPVIHEFRVNHPRIKPGDTTTLIWNTGNASSIEISDLGQVAHSGSSQVHPEKTRVYILIAKNDHGQTTQKTVEVQVEDQVPETVVEKVPDPQMLIDMFNESMDKNRLDLAGEFLNKALRTAPDHPDVLKIKAVFEAQQQAQKQAQEQRQQERLREEEAARLREQQLAEQHRQEEIRQAAEHKKQQQEAEAERIQQEQRHQQEQEKARLAAIREQEQADRLRLEQIQREQETQKQADQKRQEEEARKAEQQRLAEIEKQKQREAERVRKEEQEKQKLALIEVENRKREEERQRELERQKALATPPPIAVRVEGVEKRFNRDGLLASSIQEAAVQQLSAAGFNVVPLAEANRNRDSMVLLLEFKYIENTSAGFYSFSALTSVSPVTSNGTQKLWAKGQNGIARSIELRKVNDVFAANVEKFIRDHPQKGLEFKNQ